MKRSEMIHILNQFFLDNMVYIDGETMLEVIEEAGMQPPTVSPDACQAIMQVYYGGYSFNKWDEDLEKDEKVSVALKRRLERNK